MPSKQTGKQLPENAFYKESETGRREEEYLKGGKQKLAEGSDKKQPRVLEPSTDSGCDLARNGSG